MNNAARAILIIVLWIAAALFVIWGSSAQAADAEEWRFDCGAYQVRFGQNSLTLNDREVHTLLNSSPAVGVRPDGSEYAAVTYEFERDVYLVTTGRGDNAVLIIPVFGERAIWCEAR